MKHAENYNIPEAQLADGNSDRPLTSFQKTDREIPNKTCTKKNLNAPDPYDLHPIRSDGSMKK